MFDVPSHYHASMYGGYYGVTKMVVKVLKSGFFWSILFKNAREFVLHCDYCQCIGNIFKRHKMPLTLIQEVEIFDV